MCQTCGTDCIIDATLDQRRKISTKRLAEQADIQREMLSSLLQSIRHSSEKEYQDLIQCIRSGAAANQTAACIQENARVLRLQQKSSPTASELDDLLDAFSTMLHDRDASTQQSPIKPSLSVSTHVGPQTAFIVSPQFQVANDTFLSSNSARVALHQAYERWDRYCQTQQQAQRASDTMNTIGDLDRLDPMSNDFSGMPFQNDMGLLGQSQWTSMPRSAVVDEQSSLMSSYNAATNDNPYLWPSALRGLSSSDMTNSSASPTIYRLDDRGQLQSTHAAFVANQPSIKPQLEEYIEILRTLPAGNPETPDGGLSSHQYKFQVAKFALDSIQSRLSYEDAPLARAITDFRDAGRRFIAEGNPPAEVIGNDNDIDVSLLFRERTEVDGFNVSTWACEVRYATTALDPP